MLRSLQTRLKIPTKECPIRLDKFRNPFRDSFEKASIFRRRAITPRDYNLSSPIFEGKSIEMEWSGST